MISSWEIGLLVARGRLPLSMDPLAWFERLLEIPGVRLADISPRILVGSSFLPGRPPRDPMDRIILATAREGGYRVITRDRHMLSYADEGYVMALEC
jgi:PIN domain nuclease of toxin-antitoxin system